MSDETEDAEPAVDAATAERVSAENMRLLENIDVALTVEVGKAEIKIRDLLRLNEGSVIELDRLENWNPTRLPSISHNSVVLLGTQGTPPRRASMKAQASRSAGPMRSVPSATASKLLR